MPATEFDTAYLKADRAAKHAAEMASIWNDYLEPHPFDFELKRTGSTEWTMRVWQEKPVPPEFSVIFGEWLFDLRSALDSVVWATAVHASRQDPPPGESGLQYPIYESLTQWDKNAWRLRPLAEHQRAMLLHMQPFNSEDSDANYLGWINRLARIDRHRRLTVATARIAQAEPVLEYNGRGGISLDWGEMVFRDSFCELFRVSADDPAARIRSNPRIGIDPEIEEWSASEFWGKRRFHDRIRMMQFFVRTEIAVYEFDCTGSSREDIGFTDTFRRDSDDRRRGPDVRPIERPPRPDTVWTPAGSGRPSTADRLRGEDFPPHGRGVAPRGQNESEAIRRSGSLL